MQSPVELTPELRDAINSLGTLKHIVSPNFEHIKFAKQVTIYDIDTRNLVEIYS